MSGNMSRMHLDEFTLLRYAASDLDRAERGSADEHLRDCPRCVETLGSMARIDEEMKRLARDFAGPSGLDPGDPFACRPEAPPCPKRPYGPRVENLAMAALEAAERAAAQTGRIHEAAKSSVEDLTALLSGLPLSDLVSRFTLLYALQEAGREIAESPLRALTLAQAALDRLEAREPGDGTAERVVPLKTLAAQAHLLAGQGRTWTGELEKAKSHFEQAYRDFGDSTGDDASLANVELGESQRRAFAGDPGGAYLLARRSLATFEEMGLEDYAARARVAEGICLMKLDRGDEALESLRSALPVFRKRELWSNYVGAVNALGTCLSLLGRLDEARREYARALRTVSRERHAAWIGYIRNGLALVLFQAGNYRNAALSFMQTSRLFRDAGNIANTLTASLYEIESWTLCGELARAAQRFELFRIEVARHDALDPTIIRRLEASFSGRDPDLQEVARLRESAGQMMRQRLAERKSG